jgi:hypothetical protein
LFQDDARALVAEVRLGPKYFGLKTHDFINITVGPDVIPMKVGRIEETESFLNILQCYTHVEGVSYEGADPGTVGGKDPLTSELDVHFWRSGPLLAAHSNAPGFYIGVGRTDDASNWTGATLYKRFPIAGGLYDYEPVDFIHDEALIGYVHNEGFTTTGIQAIAISTEIGFGAGYSEFVRGTGSWIDDGYVVGDFVIATSFTATDNNGSWLVEHVTADTLTVRDIGDTMDDDAANEAHTIARWESRYYSGVDNPYAMLAPKMHVWDRETSFIIEMLNSEAVLESAPENEVLAGVNRMVWGGEIIGFANAVALGSNRYKISMLLRGLRDTGGTLSLPNTPVELHENNERIVLLNHPGVFFREETLSEMNKDNVYKLLPADAELDDVEEFTVDLSQTVFKSRGTLSPFSSAPPTITPFGLGGVVDITITMRRRTRAPAHVLRSESMPLQEEFEEYEVIVQGSGATPRTLYSTIQVTPNGFDEPVYRNFVVYTAADQIADGWTASDTLDIQIYQLSGSVGKGSLEHVTSVKGNIGS